MQLVSIIPRFKLHSKYPAPKPAFLRIRTKRIDGLHHLNVDLNLIHGFNTQKNSLVLTLYAVPVQQGPFHDPNESVGACAPIVPDQKTRLTWPAIDSSIALPDGDPFEHRLTGICTLYGGICALNSTNNFFETGGQ